MPWMEGVAVKKNSFLFVLLGAGIAAVSYLSVTSFAGWIKTSGLFPPDPPDYFSVHFDAPERSIAAQYRDPSRIELQMGKERREIDLDRPIAKERFVATPDGRFVFFLMQNPDVVTRIDFPAGAAWIDGYRLVEVLDEAILDRAMPDVNPITIENLFSCSDDGQAVLVQVRYCERDPNRAAGICGIGKTDIVSVDFARQKSVVVTPDLVVPPG